MYLGVDIDEQGFQLESRYILTVLIAASANKTQEFVHRNVRTKNKEICTLAYKTLEN